MVTKGDSVARLAMLLAAADFTEDEVLQLVRAIRDVRPSELLNRVHVYRHVLRDDLPVLRNAAVSVSPAQPESEGPLGSKGPQPDSLEPNQGMSDEIAAQVERLLVGEAGLPKLRAAERITESLMKRYPRRMVPTYNPKDGFPRWLKLLSRTFSASEIMHVAAVIRNTRVHGRSDDWIEKS